MNASAEDNVSGTPYPLMGDEPFIVVGGEDPRAEAPSLVSPSVGEEEQQQQHANASSADPAHPSDTYTADMVKSPLRNPGGGGGGGEAEIDYYGLTLIFLTPALGGFLYGYDIGATSFVLAMLRSSRDPDTWWHEFPMVEQGLLVSALSLGALIGSHIVLVYLAKSIGRRKEIRIAACLYLVGAMMNVMSGTIFATTQVGPYGVGIGIVTLVLGRMTYGAGVGFIMHGAPTYMAEMSPSAVRGTVVSAKETVIVFGIVVGMLMGDLMSDYPDNWSDLYMFAILGAVPMLLLTFKIPRSKRWLLMKGYREEAKESMQFVYKGNVEDEFDRMAETIGALCCRNDCSKSEEEEDDFSASGSSVLSGGNGKGLGHSRNMSLVDDLEEMVPANDDGVDSQLGGSNSSQSDHDSGDPKLTSRRYRPIMIIGLSLLVAQQASGQPSILAYSRVLFAAAGFKGHASVITVLIMGLTSMVTVSMVDRLGRKVLLLAGCAIMGTALLALALGFWDYDEENNKQKLTTWQQQLVLWSMFIYIAGYQVGYGPISWTVLSEIYPSEIRGTAMALSVEVNFFFKFMVQLCFPIVLELLGWVTTFIVFACLIVVSFLFILFKVPETKGLSLEEIQLQLRGLVPPSSSSRMYNNNKKEESSSGRTPLSSPLLEQDGEHSATQHHILTPIV